ncbi:phosphoribosylformylglycinamidine synthase subunit PurQ, partial [Raoultella planticola]|uniref:phosphoribosylformylglycinamidine synthase subunit PurQ n=2 Tax=Enterobacterales TaxID=91347 RepID=UPI0034E5CB6C
VTLVEMAFAGHCGINVDISSFDEDTLAALFNEELGAVIQINEADRAYVAECFEQAGLAGCVHYLGSAIHDDVVIINSRDTVVYRESRSLLRQWWAETTWQMQRLRDNEVCADEEHAMKQDNQDPGLNVKLTYDIEEDIAAPFILSGVRPKVAVLREQGVNSHVEMAAAFDRAGFDAVDVHMSDLLE